MSNQIINNLEGKSECCLRDICEECSEEDYSQCLVLQRYLEKEIIDEDILRMVEY